MLTRRAGVVGSPIDHSLSPVLHRAAHDALGLDGWSYGRAEVRHGQLARHVAGLGPEWVGLSVTMPGKEEALALADTVEEQARLAGGANTLVRGRAGWVAHNTDVHGLVEALRAAGTEEVGRGVVLGGGATARSALLALRQLGAREVDLLVRGDVRPVTRRLLERLDADGTSVLVRPLVEGVSLDRGQTSVVIGTLPPAVAAPPLYGVGEPVVLDVTYAPWPSNLAYAVAEATAGRVGVVRGTSMLLHQAARQVELMTGHAPPVEVMATALERHLQETTR